MAKAHSTLKTTITKTRTVKPRSRRSLTVGYSPNPRPQLTIKGRWLEAFGFTTGQPAIIDAQQGLLIKY